MKTTTLTILLLSVVAAGAGCSKDSKGPASPNQPGDPALVSTPAPAGGNGDGGGSDPIPDPNASTTDEALKLAPPEITIPEHRRYSVALKNNIQFLLSQWTYATRSTYYGSSGESSRCIDRDCQNKFVDIFISSLSASGKCSGVALGKSLVLTNFHCLNGFVYREGQRDFDGQLLVKVPTLDGSLSNDFSYVRAVISHAPNAFFNKMELGHQYSMDFALLKLDNELQITPPPVNHDYGIHDGETYFVMQFSPYGDVAPSEQTLVKPYACKAVLNSIYAPASKSNTFPVAFFSNCPIGPGNSGSPIYNKHGELVGLIAGQLSPQFLGGLGFTAKMLEIADESLKHVGHGNMLTCIPRIEKNGFASDVIPESCDKDPFDPKSKSIVSINEDDEKQLISLLNSQSLEDDYFIYSPERAQLKRTLLFDFVLESVFINRPKCIKPQKIQDLDTSKEFQLRAASLKIDAYGQLKRNSGFVLKNFPVHIVFSSLEKLSEAKVVGIKIYNGLAMSNPADKHLPDRLIFDAQIPVCD